ncbi:MAG: ATP phosphoribosyltransferase regulatory subunit, partial [Chitinophagaceae bacterium]|nr:ATP phosphoribosyltransferase regulatory subunit [Anaerolineae bacterium]
MQPFQASKIAQIGQLTIKLQAHMALYGYEIVETPLIEDADLFLTKAGDQVIEKLFTFERQGQQLALRPEFTAAAVYRYLVAGLSNTVRWQFSGPVFEDHPADGSVQHYSIGAEIIGAKGATADAEIIAMATRGLIAHGIDKIQLVIGHVGLMRRLLERFALDARTRRFILQHRDLLKNGEHGKSQLLAQLARYTPMSQNGNGDVSVNDFTQSNTQQMLGILLDATRRAETMGGRTQADIAERLLQKHQQNAEYEQINAALDFLAAWIAIVESPDTALSQAQNFIEDDAEAGRMLAEWREVIFQLRTYGIALEQIIIQPDLARTWDYYTGVVFELRTYNGLQIGGGGRYDELARLIGGEQNIPAVGFAYYVDSLLATLPKLSPK